MMNLHMIASSLSGHPKLKRFLKNSYQRAGGLLSDRKTTPNTICCVSDPRQEHLSGYDKNPWKANS